jgi:hypothetical protein
MNATDLLVHTNESIMPSPALKSVHHLPPGHVVGPACAIGSLSIVLAAGLYALKVIGRLNDAISGYLSAGKDFPKSLPLWSIWLVALLFSFGVAFAILGCPGTWRRLVIWITALFLISGWAPILSLSAREPEIAAVFIATFWSGLCALIYASRHQMVTDSLIVPTDETC